MEPDQKKQMNPKAIHALEMEILKTMGSGNPEPKDNEATSSSSVATSLFNTSQSFTMESFTVDSISAQTLDERYGNGVPYGNGGMMCQCCMKAATPSSAMELSPSSLSDGNIVGGNKSSELLPPLAEEDKDKITLVLDLDETLVHSSFLAIPHADHRFILSIDQNPVGVFVCIRPGAEQFIKELGSLYELVVFTASSPVYADTVIDLIDKNHLIKHRLYRDSCTDFGGNFIKDLSRLNRNLEKVIIIDNSSVAYLLQPYNAIAITSWFDDPTDNEIFIILEFLKKNYQIKNVYDILVSSE